MPTVLPVLDRWFVKVVLEDPGTGIREWFQMGPFPSWSRARSIAAAWEALYGENTTRLTTRDAFDGRWKQSLERCDEVEDVLP